VVATARTPHFFAAAPHPRARGRFITGSEDLPRALHPRHEHLHRRPTSGLRLQPWRPLRVYCSRRRLADARTPVPLFRPPPRSLGLSRSPLKRHVPSATFLRAFCPREPPSPPPGTASPSTTVTRTVLAPSFAHFAPVISRVPHVFIAAPRSGPPLLALEVLPRLDRGVLRNPM
jgi:hypothetical protein